MCDRLSRSTPLFVTNSQYFSSAPAHSTPVAHFLQALPALKPQLHSLACQVVLSSTLDFSAMFFRLVFLFLIPHLWIYFLVDYSILGLSLTVCWTHSDPGRSLGTVRIKFRYKLTCCLVLLWVLTTPVT